MYVCMYVCMYSIFPQVVFSGERGFGALAVQQLAASGSWAIGACSAVGGLEQVQK